MERLCFSECHSEQGHADVHAILGLSEIRRARIRIHIRRDLRSTGEGVHDDHVLGCAA